ncbi:MAG: hypothetical protein WBX15_20630, partial [Thermoanaerobaculia bacterium]
NTAIRFIDAGPTWYYAIFEDCNGNGVRNKEIDRGIDRLIAPPTRLLQTTDLVRVAFPDWPIRDPDTHRLISKESSPVRFNRSHLCSFSLNGGGTAGSLFLTDGREAAWIVRVYGATGKVRLLRYDRASGRWVE